MFYHVLVDARDWPPLGDQPPVAYVAEEALTAGSSADFSRDQPLVVSRLRRGSVQPPAPACWCRHLSGPSVEAACAARPRSQAALWCRTC